jgi:TetR/AcrR family transcriptional repressor of lmrAB and yxaGH operons
MLKYRVCKRAYTIGEAMAEVASVRKRMITAGEVLLAQRGYGITLLDVMHEAGTPRGSIYYHFPKGKEELAIEVAVKMADDIERIVDSIARRRDQPTAFLQGIVDHYTRHLTASDFAIGCPVLGITVSVDIDSPELDQALADVFERWVQVVGSALESKGLDASSSIDIAYTVVSGVEGAMVISRATHSTRALKRLRAVIPALVMGAEATTAG